MKVLTTILYTVISTYIWILQSSDSNQAKKKNHKQNTCSNIAKSCFKTALFNVVKNPVWVNFSFFLILIFGATVPCHDWRTPWAAIAHIKHLHFVLNHISFHFGSDAGIFRFLRTLTDFDTRWTKITLSSLLLNTWFLWKCLYSRPWTDYRILV